MNCPDADTLNGLVANQLDADMRIQLLDHAGACLDCHGVLTAMIDVSSAPAAPAMIDRYVIERELGSGAMGVVFAARDPELDRAVAIKLLRGGASAARLKREAQLLARLNHPNVVAVYDVGEHAGETFIAMALVDGEHLRAWLARPHPLADKLRVIREAGRGLAAAHAAGLIHRDLKPDNIFIARDGSVLVGDFGLARDASEPDALEHEPGARPPAMTQTGMVLGTPLYMAPEHMAAAPCAASDQFSLCVTAWEALYGARPFAATTFGELREQIAAGPRAPSAPPIPARIRSALERGLRANAAERFPSVDALLARLAPRRRRWPWLVAGVAGAGVAIALVIATGGRDGSEGRAAQCAPTQHLLDDVWGPTQRAGIAAPTAELVDAYARDWSALRHEVCMAPRPGPLDARADCLDRAHASLHELVAKSSGAAPDLVRSAVAALPRIGDCKTALAGVASAAQVVAGQQLLARLDASQLRHLFAGTSALDELRTLDNEATALGYEPATLPILLAEGLQLVWSGRVELAGDTLRRAIALAEEAHDDLMVARAAAALVSIVVDAGKLDEARAELALATAALARAGSDVSTELDLTNARARLAAATGDHEAAIRFIRDAIEPTVRRSGAESDAAAQVYAMLASELSLAGRLAEASEAMHHNEIIQRALAAYNGSTTVATEVQVTVAMTAGQFRRAIELGQRGIAQARVDHAGDSVELEAVLNLARAYELSGDNRRGADVYAEALALLDRQPQGGSIDARVNILEGIGFCRLRGGEPALAIEPLRSALELADKHGLVDARTPAASALGGALLATGKPREARPLLEKVVRDLADNRASKPQSRGMASDRLARALWEDGDDHDRARARTLASDAERDLEAAIGALKPEPSMGPFVSLLERELAELRTWRERRR